MNILKTLADCDVIQLTIIGANWKQNISSMIKHTNCRYECVRCVFVVYLGESNVVVNAMSNPFLFNKLYLNQWSPNLTYYMRETHLLLSVISRSNTFI